MSISIIIPYCNANEFTEECLRSIKKHTKDYEIILIDNGSKDLLELSENEMSICLIRNEENLGFPKAVNQGLARAKGDYLCVLNNDIIVVPGWAERLIWHLECGIDVIGPRTNSISGPQALLVDRYNNIEELNSESEILYKKEKHRRFPFHRLIAFCIIMRRWVYEMIGGFDEIFSPGNYEDDSYCLEAIDKGFKLAIANDVFIHHFGSITHKALDIDYISLLKRNQKIFESKWEKVKIKELSAKNTEAVNGTKRKKSN